MSESSVSVSSPEEDIFISNSSSSRSSRVSTSSEVGTSSPQLLRPLSSEPLRPSSSQPLQPSSSQRSPYLPAKNALGDVKDQAEDEASPRPWYTADEKSSKMPTEDLVELLQEYPLPVGWYARLPGLQEPANYGTKYETRIYEEQVRSGYRLPLHPFALRFFEHYHMAPVQLVPNGWRKLVGLIYLVQTLGYKSDPTDFMRVFFKICFVKGVANCPGWYYIHKMASGSGKTPQGGFLGVLQKAKWKRREKQPSTELPPAPKKIKVIPPNHSPQIVEKVSVEEDPIFRPRWTLRSNDVGMPDSQISEQHLVHGVLPRDKEIFQNQTHETFACSFAQAVYTKREAVKEAQEASHRAEELSNREEDYLAKIANLEKRLERIKRKAAEEVTKARDQGIRDFLDGNAEDEWLKKRTEDGLEIYDLGFTKAKEMFAERFPDIPLEDFVLPAVVSPSRETPCLQRREMPQLLILREKNVFGYIDHSDRAECSTIILFGQNVFGYIDHSDRAECSAITLFGQNVFGYIDHSDRAECSAITLFGQNVFGYIDHSDRAECSAITLFGQNVFG
ncbi:hypothetical protein RJ639_016504 [Escallonia herrerae]|uniref:Transposase (putative) gypsy type domain-containing protein n=1 Tax=Escallonia herrerae TaxID=1293975 RepID=A0AA88VG20_9ASTE|nr:hypothetical protein RJ639_016504 [Escallonia herrerae]